MEVLSRLEPKRFLNTSTENKANIKEKVNQIGERVKLKR